MRFAVVIPTYNRRHCLGRAIESALSQAREGVEVSVFVVDDRSTDGTLEWLAETYPGGHVTGLTNLGRKGPAGGRNTGLSAAASTGAVDAVAFLDSDDRFLDGHLAESAALLERTAGVDVVFGRARYLQSGVEVPYMGPNFEAKLAATPVVERTQAWSVFDRERFFGSLLRHGCWFNLSSVVLSAAAAAERMQEELRVSEDYEFWVRLSRQFGFACLHRPQVEYTLGDDNISFEADKAVEGHAPQLLAALDLISAYEGLDEADKSVLMDQQASVLFDWAWRARQAGRNAESWRLHQRSLRHGRRMDNLAALAKLLPALLLRR